MARKQKKGQRWVEPNSMQAKLNLKKPKGKRPVKREPTLSPQAVEQARRFLTQVGFAEVMVEGGDTMYRVSMGTVEPIESPDSPERTMSESLERIYEARAADTTLRDSVAITKQGLEDQRRQLEYRRAMQAGQLQYAQLAQQDVLPSATDALVERQRQEYLRTYQFEQAQRPDPYRQGVPFAPPLYPAPRGNNQDLMRTVRMVRDESLARPITDDVLEGLATIAQEVMLNPGDASSPGVVPVLAEGVQVLVEEVDALRSLLSDMLVLYPCHNPDCDEYHERGDPCRSQFSDIGYRLMSHGCEDVTDDGLTRGLPRRLHQYDCWPCRLTPWLRWQETGEWPTEEEVDYASRLEGIAG